MSETTKKEHAPRIALDTVRRRGLCSVLLHYAIAQHEYSGLRLLHVPLGFDEEALVVFSSWQAAQKFFLSDVFDGEWYPRECSAGELISFFLGPLRGHRVGAARSPTGIPQSRGCPDEPHKSGALRGAPLRIASTEVLSRAACTLLVTATTRS